MSATNVSLRIMDEILRNIDENAARQRMTRTEYILSWMPETTPNATHNQTSRQQNADTARSAHARSGSRSR